MSNQITPTHGQAPLIFMFGDHPIRIVMKDGEEWFVATDVAKALKYRDAPNLLRMVDKEESSTHIVSTSAGPRESIIISEPGLYQAIMVSRQPEAQPFRRWVAEVLRQIRKTGRYVAPTKLPRAMARNGRTVVDRAMEYKALTLYLEGQNMADIGRHLGVARATVARMVSGQQIFGPHAGPDQTTPELRAAVVAKRMNAERTQFVERVQTKYCISASNMAMALEYDRAGRQLLQAMGAPLPEDALLPH